MSLWAPEKEEAMKRYIPGFFAPIWGSPALIFLTALFVCGAAAGSFTGLLAASNGSEQIVQLADALAVRAGRAPNGMDAVFAALGAFGWQVSVLLAGWMRPSSLLLSLVCTVRGFTLSFSVSTLLRALGMDGVWRSLAASGMAAVITVPCLLLTAAACFSAAQSAPRGQRGGYFYALGRYRGAVLGCTLAAVWAAVMQLPLGWMVERWIL